MNKTLFATLAVAVITISLVPTTAQAQSEDAPRKDADDWTAGQSLSIGALGMAGSAVGGTAGFFVGGLTAAGSCDSNDGFGCLGAAFLGAGLGALVGTSFGASVAIWSVGEHLGYRGSYIATLGAAALGSVGGIALLAVDPIASLIGVVVLPAAFGTVAYYLSLDDVPHSAARPTGALLGYSPDGGLRLDAPNIGVTRHDEGLSVHLPLLGGQF